MNSRSDTKRAARKRQRRVRAACEIVTCAAILATTAFLIHMEVQYQEFVENLDKATETAEKAVVYETTVSYTAPQVVVLPEPEPVVEVEAAKLYYDVPLSNELQDHIMDVCAAHEIDPAIVVAMADRETDFDAGAIGDSGEAFGLLQVWPKWHKDRMDRLGVTDLLDPFQNVTVSVDYLAELLHKYDGNMAKALTAYNAGPTGAYKHYFSKGINSNGYSLEIQENSRIYTEGMIEK